MNRRLTVILAIDVVGYSRLMGADEAGTLAALKKHRSELIDPKAVQYGGRTIKLMGDGALMEFASVIDAVRFAVEVQCNMINRNSGTPADKKIEFRIGINVGDVMDDDGDIYGDGVNLAARIEGLAQAGGICVHDNVQSQVVGKLDLDFEDLGPMIVKNIDRPVPVFNVELNEKATRLVSALEASKPERRQRSMRAVGGALGALVLVAGCSSFCILIVSAFL